MQNKISAIEGLEGLINLRMLELGANRIRVGQGFIVEEVSFNME